jgi:predicted RNA-binding protein with TRAM domain
MSKQILEVGDNVAFIKDGQDHALEVTAVSYQEDGDKRVNFSYTLKHPDDIERPEPTEAE